MGVITAVKKDSALDAVGKAIALLRQDRKPGWHPGTLKSAIAGNRFSMMPRTKRLFGQELAFQLDLLKGALVGSVVGFMAGLLGVEG